MAKGHWSKWATYYSYLVPWKNCLWFSKKNSQLLSCQSNKSIIKIEFVYNRIFETHLKNIIMSRQCFEINQTNVLNPYYIEIWTWKIELIKNGNIQVRKSSLKKRRRNVTAIVSIQRNTATTIFVSTIYVVRKMNQNSTYFSKFMLESSKQTYSKNYFE